jgi:hypothetical protein
VATYKQPRRLNVVTLTILAVVGVAGYVGFSAWPVLSQYANVKTELEDALPRLYHANLSPDPDGTLMTEEVRQEVLKRLDRLAVPDAAKNLIIERNTKTVGIRISYLTVLALQGTSRRFPLTLAPHVETSAERVNW